MAAAQSDPARDGRGRSFREISEGREHPRENHQHGSHQNGEPVGLFDGQILGNHFAENDVRIADEQEGDSETHDVPQRRPAGQQDRMNQRLEQFVDRVFSGPAQAETGQRDAGLGERKQPGRIRQQIQRGLRPACPSSASVRKRLLRTEISATSAVAKSR
jgi:hypothetical protein